MNRKTKKRYIIETCTVYKGLDCVVILNSWGNRCGYVGIKKDSPLFGVDYSQNLKKPELLKEIQQTTIGKRGILPLFCWDGETVSPEILFNVHGGITYSGGDCFPVTRPYSLWWFGFDCAHAGDAKDWESVEKVFDKSLYKTSRETDKKYFISDGVIRTLKYVEKECENLVEQILCVESTY